MKCAGLLGFPGGSARPRVSAATREALIVIEPPPFQGEKQGEGLLRARGGGRGPGEGGSRQEGPLVPCLAPRPPQNSPGGCTCEAHRRRGEPASTPPMPASPED